MRNNSLTRRSFAKGGAAGAAIAAFAPLAATTSKTMAYAGEEEKDYTPDEVIDADIVVVGSGGGGLAAAIEAAESGLNVVVLESQKVLGGNFNFTIGICGANSPMVKELGESQDIMELVNNELRLATYTVDALKWIDLLEASGDNITWLLDHGCKLDEPVAYWADPNAEWCKSCPVLYHQWSKGFRPVDALVPAAESAGAVFMTSTPGRKLISKDGAVTGIYAEREDGSILQINSKAVVLATGGWLDDEEHLSKFTRGRNHHIRGVGGRYGDGIRMAKEVGARSTDDHDLVMGWAALRAENEMAWYNGCFIYTWGKALMVNQDGDRFCNEGMSEHATSGPYINAILNQPKSYVIFDAVFSNSPGDLNPDVMVGDMLDGAIEKGETTLWKADTFEELFEKAGVDKDAFMKTVTTYNEYCRNGKDLQFAKNPEMLAELVNPPFYMVENTVYFSTTLANLDYDRKMRVVDKHANPIPGLYVAGVDGAQIYDSIYTLEATAGSCNANNINSGRVAVQSAIADFGLVEGVEAQGVPVYVTDSDLAEKEDVQALYNCASCHADGKKTGDPNPHGF